MNVPISSILLILPIEKSVGYVFSTAIQVVPFQSGFELTHYQPFGICVTSDWNRVTYRDQGDLPFFLAP